MDNKFSKDSLTKLYQNNKSMTEIANLLHCSIHKISYWMSKYQIPKRTHSEASYIKNNPFGDPFNIKTSRTQEEQKLFGLGIGIYWGEGNKVSLHAIRVANTDPNMIKVFIRFLKEICRVPERKFGYSIVCFHDTEPEHVRSYWANELNILPEKFGKIVQIPTQGKGTYKKKSLYGVCTVTVSNLKLKAWLMDKIREVSSPR